MSRARSRNVLRTGKRPSVHRVFWLLPALAMLWWSSCVSLPPELIDQAEEELRRELEEMNAEPEPFIPPAPTEITFHAVYQNVIDEDRLGDTIGPCAMSTDGRKIAFRNRGGIGDELNRVYLMDTDGTGLEGFDVHGDLGPLSYVAISGDGTRAYFATSFNQTILKLESGNISTYDLTGDDGPDGIDTLRTTTTGDYVYFHGNRDSNVWRLRHDGTGLQRVVDVDDPAMPPNGAAAFDISADASVLVFSRSMGGEIYKLAGGGITQLTNEGGYGTPRITPDGNTVYYRASASADQPGWWLMSASGGAATWMSNWPSGLNLAASEDGATLFVGDTRAKPDNTAFALFPSTGLADFSYSMSSDGALICFRPDFGKIYVGHIAAPDVVLDVPVVESIGFDPSRVPRGDPNAQVVAVVKASAEHGLEPAMLVRVAELLDGRIAREHAAPIVFPDLYDHSYSPDGVADDGVFSGIGSIADGIDAYDSVTVRISAYDTIGNIVVADAVLPIGG